YGDAVHIAEQNPPPALFRKNPRSLSCGSSPNYSGSPVPLDTPLYYRIPLVRRLAPRFYANRSQSAKYGVPAPTAPSLAVLFQQYQLYAVPANPLTELYLLPAPAPTNPVRSRSNPRARPASAW